MNNRIALQILRDVKQLNDQGVGAIRSVTVTNIFRMPGFIGITEAEIATVFQDLITKGFLVQGATPREWIVNPQKDGISFYESLVNRAQQTDIDQNELSRLTLENARLQKENFQLQKHNDKKKYMLIFISACIGAIVAQFQNIIEWISRLI